jgi:hypothetical protein
LVSHGTGSPSRRFGREGSYNRAGWGAIIVLTAI